MSTDVAQRTPQQELMAQVRGDVFRDQVAAALPEGMNPERFVRVMVTALVENPDLANGVDHGSIFSAGLKAAADGLLPNGRESAFVVFNTKDGKKAQYFPMIGGFRKIAGEHGWTLDTKVVYANDDFLHERGLEEKLRHVPVRPGADPGEPIAAYAVSRHRDGRTMFEVLTAAEIEKVRQVSRSKDRGPWVEWPERMWEKSAGRRLFSKLPLGERDSERILRVLEASSADEGGAAAALYGSEREQAAESLPRPAPASGDDPAPRSDEPDPEPEPVDAAAQVEVAGAMVIPTGNNKGKTIAEVGSAEKGHSWIKWCIKQRDHECSEAAGVWAKENLPALYQQAMGELETQEG